jgi:hypothetical protein
MLWTVFALAMCPCLGGCTATGNVIGTYGGGFIDAPKVVFGGTQANVAVLTHPAAVYEDCGRPTCYTSDGQGNVTAEYRAGQPPPTTADKAATTALRLALSLVDLPLSFAVDTLTLGITVPHALERRAAERAPRDTADPRQAGQSAAGSEQLPTPPPPP